MPKRRHSSLIDTVLERYSATKRTVSSIALVSLNGIGKALLCRLGNLSTMYPVHCVNDLSGSDLTPPSPRLRGEGKGEGRRQRARTCTAGAAPHPPAGTFSPQAGRRTLIS